MRQGRHTREADRLTLTKAHKGKIMVGFEFRVEVSTSAYFFA